jgi:hypothetical protein
MASDAGLIWLHALSGVGNNIADAMQQYHKEHTAYDQQSQLADAMSRLGLNQQGQITPIDPNNPDKTIQPIIDPKAVQLFQTNNHDQQVKNTGAMEALSRIGMHVISQTAGPAAQARLKEAQLATQRIPTQIGDTTLDLTPGQSANVRMAQQPKAASPYTQFRMDQAKAKADQQQQEKLPEFQFQKKYQLMPKDILSQPMGYEQGKDAQGNPSVVPTTPVFRERKYTVNQGGIKQDAYTPDPNGDIINYHDQRIPYSDYATLQNRAQFVYARAKDALARGTPPDQVQARLEQMGFDPAGVQ